MTSRERMARIRTLIAAAAVWVPLLVVGVTWLLWRDDLPAQIALRNDIDPGLAVTLPSWVILSAVVIVLVGLGIAAIGLVPEGANDAHSRRVPLFWCGAVAGCTAAIWVIQSWVAVHQRGDSALLGFLTIAAALYGLVPLLIAGRPPHADSAPTPRSS